MKTSKMLLAMVAVIAGAALCRAADLPSQAVITKAVSSLARVEYRIENELMSSQQNGGMAVCIDAANGVFISRDVTNQMPPDELKQFKLSTPGPNSRSYDAELLGIDPETGLAFLRAKRDKKDASYPWTELKFETRTPVRIGQPVMSVGMLSSQIGDAPYLGTGTVAANLRLPAQLIYVSGDLTGSSSPVLDAEGKVIGMVGGQLPMECRLIIGGRAVDAAIIGRERTMFFIPSEDFAHVLAKPPTPGQPRKLVWLGVLGLQPVSPDMAEIKKVAGKAAVLVGQVLPDGPAGKAGIMQGDVIVAVNDKPLEPLATPELTAADFERSLVKNFKPGDKINLTIVRNGQSSNVALTLEAMPIRAFEAPRYYNKALGFGARELTVIDRYANRLTPLKESGLAVIVVAQNSPAARAGLQGGDIVTAVNKKPVPTAEEMKKVMTDLAKAKPEGEIELLVLRGDSPLSVVIKP